MPTVVRDPHAQAVMKAIADLTLENKLVVLGGVVLAEIINSPATPEQARQILDTMTKVWPRQYEGALAMMRGENAELH